jgi:hypothetical protein
MNIVHTFELPLSDCEKKMMRKYKAIYKTLGGIVDVKKFESNKAERQKSLKLRRESQRLKRATWKVSQMSTEDRHQGSNNFDVLVEEVNLLYFFELV